jgi:hypothetical protein
MKKKKKKKKLVGYELIQAFKPPSRTRLLEREEQELHQGGGNLQ